MTSTRSIVIGVAAIAALSATNSALAGAHTWRINEVFSTADGLVQFIELRESFGGSSEVFLGGLQVRSLTHTFTFPANLVPPTTNRHILLATQSFADLPGAPTPNHIIVPNFFNPAGDTITYNNGIYDTWAIGAIPTDCVNSRHRNFGNPNGPFDGPNTPTNYAGQTATGINACPAPPCTGDVNGDGNRNFDDILAVIFDFGPCQSPPCAADVNGDNAINFDDILAIIFNYGLCP